MGLGNFSSKYIKIYRQGGFRAILQEGGWKILIIFFMFFLVKGLLWLLIPYLIAKGLLS
jgi:hypothetical protein